MPRPPRPHRRPAAPVEISRDDAALFREAIGSVTELSHDRAELRPTPPPPRAHHTLADERAALREAFARPTAELELEMGEPLSYVADGQSRQLLRKLGRGQFAVADEIDLHHMNRDEAAAAIRLFLGEAKRERHLCVRIIHGKGLRSKGPGPVLKHVTDQLLRQRGDVLAFRSARAVDGGSGAVLVLLKP